MVITVALKANAVAFILSRHHPGGNLKPGKPDIELAAKIKEAGKYANIQALHDIVVTGEGYYKFVDEGVL